MSESYYIYETQYDPKGEDEVTKYEDLTHEDKQAALDEAHEIMNPEERLNDIEKYANGSFVKNVAPILKENELEFLISMARKGLIKDDDHERKSVQL